MLRSLSCTNVMFLLSLSSCFSCYASLKFTKTYNGKSENEQFLASQLSVYINAYRVVLPVSYDLCKNRSNRLVARVTYRVKF